MNSATPGLFKSNFITRDDKDAATQYRPEAVGTVAREDAQHAGGQEDPAARVPLRMARHRPRGQAGRRLPLLSGRDEDGAVNPPVASECMAPICEWIFAN
jgi:hypothetical protein